MDSYCGSVWPFLYFGFLQVSGLDGGKQIAMLLQARGVKLSFLLDEGSGILDGVIEGIKSPVAL